MGGAWRVCAVLNALSPAPAPVFHLETIDSTNAEALRRFEAGGGACWIVAERQTEGRGRRGRRWVSGREDLTVTRLALVSSEQAKRAGQLSFAAALAMADAAAALAPRAEIGLKWPNDLLLASRKAGGALLESASRGDGLLGVAIGVGLNLGAPPDLDRPTASLREAVDAPIDVTQVFASLQSSMEKYLSAYQSRGFQALRGLWLARAVGLGEHITARGPNHAVDGVFEDLDPEGALLLREPSGRMHRIAAGEVFFSEVR